MIGQSLIANTSACPRSDKRVPDFIFAKGLTVAAQHHSDHCIGSLARDAGF
jgi:hypothetical protein